MRKKYEAPNAEFISFILDEVITDVLTPEYGTSEYESDEVQQNPFG